MSITGDQKQSRHGNDKNNKTIPLKQKYGNESFSPPIIPKSSIIGYLVWSRECQIPDIDPFAPSIRRTFKKNEAPKCYPSPRLTEVNFDKANKPLIYFKDKLSKEYGNLSLSCCFSQITRSGSGDSSDDQFTLSECTSFNQTFELDTSLRSILVTCKNNTDQTVYANIHVLIPRNETVLKRLEGWKAKDTNPRPPNVILFGIDSISRMNLIRTMPKTTEYLRKSGWFEMAGYNKIGDNTFPNLMALMTGYNETNSLSKCKPTTVGGLDACPFVWTAYQKAGYVTAYAEDEQFMSTFNYLKKGFKDPPTDNYLRPTMLAAENHLKPMFFDGLRFCLGFQSSPEYVYNYIFQVRNAYEGYPFFGLFWTNTFSHNTYDAPSAMDEKIVEYFQSFNSTGILDESIVFFLSDHGMRFGPLRLSPTGHLEERLPFFFMWLPPKFREKHPEIVQALKTNQNRLTTPFDAHVTLNDILQLSGRVENLQKSEDCPKCQSLFEIVPGNRSCEDAAISDHWCTCRAFHNVDKNSINVNEVTLRTVDYINDILKKAKNGTIAHLCHHLELDNIMFANQEVLPHLPAGSTLDGFQITFKTKPGGAIYETTVRLNMKSREFTIVGTISRMNMYDKFVKCIDFEAVNKYCICKNLTGTP